MSNRHQRRADLRSFRREVHRDHILTHLIEVNADLGGFPMHLTLGPQLERPELRKFRSYPVAIVLADRCAYIAACLTICRAYIIAGRPTPARKLRARINPGPRRMRTP